MYFPSIRPGRIASALAAAVMTASLVAAPAYADSRVVATIGADLTAAQKQTVIDYFGSSMANADLIYVTNADEHAHLDGYVPYEQIGNATYSCALICPTNSGGIHVRAANLNYVTADMLASALSSAGVRNADVIAICPFKVSGTGALTGVLLAYETATGQPLDQTKKDVATQELVVTQSLSNQVGSDVATLIVNDVKANVVMNNVTDESEINTIVDNTVNNIVSNNTTVNNTTNVTNVDNSTTVIDNSTVNVTEVTYNNTSGLSDEDIAALKELAKSYAEAGYNYEDMAETLDTVSKNASAASGVTDPLADQLADAAADAAASNTGSQEQTGASDSDAGAAGDTATTDGNGTTDASGASGVGDASGTGAAGGASTGETPTTTDGANSSDGASSDNAASASDSTVSAQPAETPAPSIFDGTNDAALGSDTTVTATDKDAAADTPTSSNAADNGGATSDGTTNPDDPFGGLSWDESGQASNQDASGTSNDQAADSSATDQPSDPTAGQPDGAATPGETTDSGDAADASEPALADAPAPVESANVTLVATNSARTSQLVDGTALIVSEDNGKQTLTDMADGSQLLSGAYDEIHVLSNDWAYGVTTGTDEFSSTVDVYYLPGSTTVPVGTTTSDLLANARADGDCLNVAAASGAVTAYDKTFTPVEGAAPADVDDFSYANATITNDAAATDTAATADEATAQPQGQEGAAEPTASEDSQPAGAEAAATADAQTAVTLPAVVDAQTPPVVTGDPTADGSAETSADQTAPSALPSNATEVVGTNGALYTVADADGKVHLLDADGIDLFGRTFDQVISAHSGSYVVLVDKASDTAWSYEVKVPTSL